MPSVALVETGISGHRRVWLGALSSHFLRSGYEVILITPRPDIVIDTIISSSEVNISNLRSYDWESPNFVKQNGRYLKNLYITCRAWLSLGRKLKELPHQPELILFPYLDPFLCHGLIPKMLDIFFQHAWYGIYFQPQWTRINQAKHAARPCWLLEAFATTSTFCQGVGILDEGVKKQVSKKLSKPVDCFPDFIYPPIQTHQSKLGKEARERAGDRKIVAFLGTIQSRKGFEDYLRLLEAADSKDFFFLIAGKFCATQKPYTDWTIAYWSKIKKDNLENVMIHDHAIDADQDYYDLFRQSDIIWGAYEDWPHSSNVLSLAAAFEKPILVREHYLMAERVENHKLGFTLSNQASTSELLDTLTLCSTWKPSTTSKQFTELHSLKALQDTLEQIKSTSRNSMQPTNEECTTAPHDVLCKP